MNTDELMLNLRIISKIPEGGKISLRDGVFVVEDGWIASIFRFTYGYDRHRSIRDISCVVSDSIDKIKELYNSIYFDKEMYPVEYGERYTKVVNMSNALVLASSGLENLRQTYHKDYVCSSKIDIIIQEIKNFFPDIRSFITIAQSSTSL